VLRVAGRMAGFVFRRLGQILDPNAERVFAIAGNPTGNNLDALAIWTLDHG
jgi:hypothetical protein